MRQVVNVNRLSFYSPPQSRSPDWDSDICPRLIPDLPLKYQELSEALRSFLAPLPFCVSALLSYLSVFSLGPVPDFIRHCPPIIPRELRLSSSTLPLVALSRSLLLSSISTC